MNGAHLYQWIFGICLAVVFSLIGFIVADMRAQFGELKVRVELNDRAFEEKHEALVQRIRAYERGLDRRLLAHEVALEALGAPGFFQEKERHGQ